MKLSRIAQTATRADRGRGGDPAALPIQRDAGSGIRWLCLARRFLAPVALASRVQRSAGLTSFYFGTVAPTTVSHCLAMTSLAAFCSSSVGNFALA